MNTERLRSLPNRLATGFLIVAVIGLSAAGMKIFAKFMTTNFTDWQLRAMLSFVFGLCLIYTWGSIIYDLRNLESTAKKDDEEGDA